MLNSQSIPHPLRPLGTWVLVCEGESDYQLLSQLWSTFAQAATIQVFYASGSKNVRPLASILEPSFSISDRDFSRTILEAKSTFADRRIFWSHVDIESYLLYPDWLLEATNTIRGASNQISTKNFPQSHMEIEEHIFDAANILVPHHAGMKILDTLRGMAKFYAPKNDNESWDANDWKKHLISEAQEVLQTSAETNAHMDFQSNSIIQAYDREYTYYEDLLLKKDLNVVREEFSGKRVLPKLAQRWGVRSIKQPPKQNGWEILRDEIIVQTLKYVISLQGLLKDDERLGDFGKLASRIIEQSI